MSEEIVPLGSTTVDGHTRTSVRIRNRIMSSQTPSSSQADTSTPAPKPKAKRGSAARGKSSSGPLAPGTQEVGGYTPSPDVLNMLLNQMQQNNPYNLSQPDDGVPDDSHSRKDDSHSREKDTHRKDGDPKDSNKKDSNKKDTQNRDGHGHKDSPSPDDHSHAKDTNEQGIPNGTPSGNGSGGTPLGTPGQGGPGGGPTDPSATKGAGTPPGGGPTPPPGLGGQDHPKTDQPDLSKVPANLEILPPRYLAQWAMRWREANRSLAHWSRNFTGGSQADQDLWMDQNIEAYFDYQRLVRLHGTEQNPISDTLF